jgi:hypothetical protein
MMLTPIRPSQFWRLVDGYRVFFLVWIALMFAFGGIHCSATLREGPTGTEIVLCKAASDVVVKVTGGHTAVTLPGRISLFPPNPDPALICHEGIHREQETRIGPDKWPAAYLLEHLAHGYQGNKYENEARDRCAHLGPS